MQGKLFSENKTVKIPKTQSIKYIGSKLKILPYILEIIQRLKPNNVLDGFSGSTRVSQALAALGYEVISNDIAEYSAVLGSAYLLNREEKRYYSSLIDHLNHLKGYDGWFTEHYGGFALPGTYKCHSHDELKKPFQIHNTRKLDAIRDEIDKLTLSPIEKCVALTSLMLALDEVDNTLGHFSSYLNNWSPRSYKTMQLKVPDVFQNTRDNRVLKGDIFDCIDKVTVDLAYFDPPYGSNNEKMPPSRVRYSAYYHLWTTICLNDKPELFGKVGRRVDTSDTISSSVFEEFRRADDGQFIAVKAIDRLLSQTNAKFILLSYSSGGRATAQELIDVINTHGRLVQIESIDYKKNIMASLTWTNAWLKEVQEPNKEFLFLIEKK
jgi:adenine-specific DNA-methyltransferase